MHSERGFHRLVNFSDAVVAIAITLLVLPLVDSASSIGTIGPGAYIDANRTRLFAFALSFAVIGLFWWGQHQLFEFVAGYNSVVVWGMFIWLFSIVFLPFPTELLGSSSRVDAAGHAIYVGTMLVTSIAALIQNWAIVRWPELQRESTRGQARIDASLISVVLMSSAFVLVVAVPTLGLWPLLILGASRPLEMLRSRRVHS
ncbi:MAG: TMEM175 family protein [Acidimicrobiales bacterium]|jgi:uncharacterized membrane protein